MIAIAGLIALPPFQAAPRAGHRMLDVIRAPACPVTDVWREGGVTLGAKCAKGVSALHADPEIVVVANARLDNRTDLCGLLDLRQSASSDAILICKAYEAWGTGCASRLRGDFAFALWDVRRQRLFCARDRFGVKPLYYRRTDFGVRFGSEAKAIAADAGLAAFEIDQRWAVDFAAGLVTSHADTPHADIKALPSAHLLTWSHGQLVLERYWSLEDIAGGCNEHASEALRGALEEAVENRMSGKATAALLSGGLDSSSICCLGGDIAAREGLGSLPTVSLVFDETPEEDERSYIEAVLAKGQFSPRLVSVSDYRPIAALRRLIEVHDGPFLAPGQPLMEHAYAAVVAEGAHVLLDGHGGDEVISHGFGRLDDLARAGKWAALFAEVVPLSINRGWNPYKVYSRYVRSHSRGMFGRIARRTHLQPRKAALGNQPELLNPHWTADQETRKRQLMHARAHPGFFESERSHHAAMLGAPLQSHALEVLDRISRYHGFDTRFPFWDQEVIEICLRAPSSTKLASGSSRALLRSAMRDVLPEAVRTRKDKLNFAGHAVRGMLRDKDLLLDIARTRNSSLAGLIDLGAFEALVHQLEDSKRERRGVAAALIWLGASLGVWLEARQTRAADTLAPLEERS